MSFISTRNSDKEMHRNRHGAEAFSSPIPAHKFSEPTNTADSSSHNGLQRDQIHAIINLHTMHTAYDKTSILADHKLYKFYDLLKITNVNSHGHIFIVSFSKPRPILE